MRRAKLVATPGKAIRYLAPSEAMFVEMGTVVGYSVRARGELDEAALSDAFDVLRHRYPALRGQLGTLDGELVFMTYAGHLPEISVITGDLDAPLGGFDAGSNDAMSALHVVRAGDAASVTLWIPHCLADAGHGLALSAELWSLYTDRMVGDVPTSIPGEHPASLEALLADRGISKPGDESARWSAPAVGEPDPLDTSGLPFYATTNIRLRLSAHDTAALRLAARRDGVTVHGLVSAAILRAQSDIDDAALADIPYVSAVDLRGRITPPVPPAAATNMLGYVPYKADVESTRLIDLARSVNDRLLAQLGDGSVLLGALYIPDLAKHGSGSGPKGVLGTNLGAVPALRTPPGLEIEDFRASHYRKPLSGKLHERGLMGMTTYLARSYAGWLSIDLMTYEPSPQDIAVGDRKIAAIENHLLSLR